MPSSFSSTMWSSKTLSYKVRGGFTADGMLAAPLWYDYSEERGGRKGERKEEGERERERGKRRKERGERSEVSVAEMFLTGRGAVALK